MSETLKWAAVTVFAALAFLLSLGHASAGHQHEMTNALLGRRLGVLAEAIWRTTGMVWWAMLFFRRTAEHSDTSKENP